MTVYLAKQPDTDASVRDVLQFFAGKFDLTKGVLLKPNIVYPVRDSSGEITRRAVVRAVVNVLREIAPDVDIVIGESTAAGTDPQENFRASGYRDLARKLQVDLVDLDQVEHVELKWKYGGLEVPRIALERVYLNLPIFKPSAAATISGAMKNQKGLLLCNTKKKFHKLGLHDPLACLNQIIQPDLSILDYANFSDENVLIAGDDTYEVDALASCMVKAPEAEHLRIMREEYGRKAEFEVAGIDFRVVESRRFIELTGDHTYLRLRVWPNARACSMCRRVLSDIKRSPLKNLRYKVHMYRRLWWHALRGAEIVIGAAPFFTKEHADVICIGDCTRKLAEDNGYLHVPGCPPTQEAMMTLGNTPTNGQRCGNRANADDECQRQTAEGASELSTTDGALTTDGSISPPTAESAQDPRHLPFPLTDIQQAYWIGRSGVLPLGDVSTHIYLEIECSHLDMDRLNLALQRLIERHDMLRAVVLPDGRQQVLEQVPPYRIAVLDLREEAPDGVETRLAEVRSHMSHQVLPSDRWPLFDFRASRLGDREFRLHLSMDMLILDARSQSLLFYEWSKFYADPELRLPAPGGSFREFVLAELAGQGSERYQRDAEYWAGRLASLPAGPDLPLAKNPSSISRARFSRQRGCLDSATWERLKQQASKKSVRPSALLLAAFAEVLKLWSGNPRFTINVTLFNRKARDPRLKSVLGDFTSSLLLGVDPCEASVFEDRAAKIQQQLREDLDHSTVSGVHVIRELNKKQRGNVTATMPVVFTSLVGAPSPADDAVPTAWLGESKWLGESIYTISQTPQVSLDHQTWEESGELIFVWDSVQELFPEDLLQDMFRAYGELLRRLACEDDIWQATWPAMVDRLLPAEQLQQRARVNATAAAVPTGLLHSPFLARVADYNDQPAVISERRTLTYDELFRHSNQVGRWLRSLNVQPNSLVAVVMEKGWEQVVAVLGVLASGAAYLPIDAALPKERLGYLLDHGQVDCVLTQSRVDERVEWPAGIHRMCVDSDELSGIDDSPLEPVQQPEDLAYVIFTSGSTGLPKGVMIDHRGALNTITDINNRFGVGSEDSILALSSLSFDLSVYDIFGTLAAGGRIIMPSATETRDPAQWAQWIAQEGVTIWNSVPALMSLLVEHVAGHPSPPSCASLRLVMMSGDWIPVNLPEQIRTHIAAAHIISLGGATEASIWSIMYPIDKVGASWKSIPYGQPMANQQFQVLSDAGTACPTWVPGELFIGGVGLAKGYWRDEEKTQSSFITHPGSGERLYRTGDLGRYLPDGDIEFLGREDSQVKLRGYRIELGEIEFQLQRCQGIESCTVAMREDEPGEKRLVAYFVAEHGVAVEPNELRDRLRSQLPEYMVPTAFVPIEQLPLTANGKVNRKVLPMPTRSSTDSAATSAAPRDTLELQMTKLWEKALRVRPVQLGDNFFDLGGDSLIAVRLFSEIRKLTGRELPLSTLLQAPTVESLSGLLRTDGWSPSWSSLVPIEPGGSNPPFFCVHGAGGNVLLFRDLARRLAPDWPFYGLQPQGLGGGRYHTTVEEMAAYYLGEIQQLQPEGPYYVGGYCLGGMVALELARRLRAQGQRVAFLGMLDTLNCNGVPINMSWPRRIRHILEKFRFHLANVAPLSSGDRLFYGRNELHGIWERATVRLRLKASNLLSKLAFWKSRGEPAVYIHDVGELAHFQYKPELYAGEITLFGLRKNHSYVTDPKMGWDGVAAGGVHLIELPMYPGGMFVEPHVQATADQLRECLNQAAKAAAPADDQTTSGAEDAPGIRDRRENHGLPIKATGPSAGSY